MSRPASAVLQRFRAVRAFVRRVDRRLDRGVTLIEALVVVAIVGILVAGGVPAFAAQLAGHRASTAVYDFAHAIAMTRAEALARGRRVYLGPLSGRWHDGWAIFVDRDDDRRFDAAVDDTIVRHDALSAAIDVANPASAREPFTDTGGPARPYVMFDGSGYARQRSGAFAAGSIRFTATGGGRTAVRTLCLASLGRVRIVDKPTC